MFVPELAASALLFARARIPIPIFDGHWCLSSGVAMLIFTVIALLLAAWDAATHQGVASRGSAVFLTGIGHAGERFSAARVAWGTRPSSLPPTPCSR